MKIVQHEDGGKGRFETEDGLAHIAYHLRDQYIVVDHTEVDPSLKGKGVGKRLVAAIADWARSQQLLVITLCPFAKAVFERTTDWHDIWHRTEKM